MDREQFDQFLAQHADTLADLGNADETVLAEIQESLGGHLDELRPKVKDKTLDDAELDQLARLTPALREVKGEVANRDSARSERYGEVESFLNEFDAESAEPEAGDEESGTTPEDVENDTETSEQQAEQVPQPVAASAKKTAAKTTPRVPPIGSTGRKTDTTPRGHQAGIAITAAADVSGYSAGQNLPFDKIGEAMSERLGAMRTVGGGNGEQVRVVTLRASGVPDERKLKRGNPGINTNRLDAVTSPHALTAAGGLCAPLEIDYSYQAIGSQGRPIRDSLPVFQAERGGIQYRPDISPVTDVSSPSPFDATGHWTNADDEAVEGGPLEDEPKTKALWVVDCPDTKTAEVEAITLQTEWSNVTSRFDPETVQANQAAALIAHDRHCEQWLLSTLQAKSKIVTSAKVLGGTRDLLVTLDRISAYYRSVHRLSSNVTLKAILPFWAKFMIRSDMARTMSLNPTETFALTDAQVDGFLATRGISPVWHLDGKPTDTTAVTGPPAIPAIEKQQYALLAQGAAVPNYPQRVDLLLFSEGHFTFLDGGTLDLGIVRDSRLIEINRYRQFSETWEGVADRGVESLRVLAECRPTGETSGAVAVSATA